MQATIATKVYYPAEWRRKRVLHIIGVVVCVALSVIQGIAVWQYPSIKAISAYYDMFPLYLILPIFIAIAFAARMSLYDKRITLDYKKLVLSNGVEIELENLTNQELTRLSQIALSIVNTRLEAAG